MNAPLRWPHLAEPPHDPKSLLLAGWIGPQPDAGWRLRRLAGTQLTRPASTLTLAFTPEAARRLTEANGSFGALRPPPSLALGPGGDLYLLDPARPAVLRLDPCSCRFEALPCGLRAAAPAAGCTDPAQPGIGARVGAPPLTLLSDPAAIAICGGTLYIADRGHARVLVFALDGWVPRGALRLPRAQATALAAPWRPADLAFDGSGRLHVLDAMHGRIDRFDAQGRWLDTLAAPGAQGLLIDCGDTVVVRRAAEHAQPLLLPAAPALYLEFDGGAESVDWQALRIEALAGGAALDIAVGVGPAILGPALLAQLPPSAWTPRATGHDAAANGRLLPLALDAQRVLRVRLVPRAGAAGAAFTLVAQAATAQRLHDGAAVALTVESDRLAAAPLPAPVLPLQLDLAGRLFVECPLECGEVRWQAFELPRGEPLAGLAPPARRYKRQGLALTRVLDSGIDGCPWHRIELRGTIPPGCSVELRTATAPLALDDGEIDALDERAWCTRTLLRAPRDSAQRGHDALVRSPPGRFLVLQLVLRGDGAATPCVESIVVEYPRVSLRRFLPAVYGADPAGADFTDRFSALFDATLRSIERPLDRLDELFDPLAAPSGSTADRLRRAPGDRRGDFLGWLGSWVGVTLDRDLPEPQRRLLLRAAGRLHCLSGTREGLWRQLLVLLGFDRALAQCADLRPQTRCTLPPSNCAPPPACTPAAPPPLILEHFKLRRWLHAGHGRLGADSQLWGAAIVNRSQLDANARVEHTQLVVTPDPLRDPLHVHAHRISVFVPARVQGVPAVQRALERLLAAEVPAHVQAQVHYVAPRFRVGRQAMLGLDSVIARTPQGVSLDDTALGQGSVLGEPPQRAAQGWAPRVGAVRVGAAAVLR